MDRRGSESQRAAEQLSVRLSITPLHIPVGPEHPLYLKIEHCYCFDPSSPLTSPVFHRRSECEQTKRVLITLHRQEQLHLLVKPVWSSSFGSFTVARLGCSCPEVTLSLVEPGPTTPAAKWRRKRRANLSKPNRLSYSRSHFSRQRR